jgi:hypothetical protein
MFFTIRSLLPTAFDALTIALSRGIINPFFLFFNAELKHVINNHSLSLVSNVFFSCGVSIVRNLLLDISFHT